MANFNFNATLAKFVDAVALSTVRPNGTAPAAAPNSFTDKMLDTISQNGNRGVIITFRVNPDGQSAWAKVAPENSKGEYSIQGPIDLAVLATKLV